MPKSRRSSTPTRPAGDRLPGLGPKSALWLREVGIESEADLRSLGAAAAYRRLKHRDRVSLNMLYGLHAALAGVPLGAVDDETKARLREEAGV